MIKHILLAFDGSEPSSKAFDAAADLARRYQALLHVLTVAQPPEIGDEVETEAVVEQSRRYHKSQLRGLKHRGDRFGIKPQVELQVGHPAQQILVGVLERVAGTGDDRVDGARADPRSEQLLAQLDNISAGDPVTDRQGHHRRLKPRPERALSHFSWQRCSLP